MNIDQLERVRKLIREIREELVKDREGTSWISEKLGELWTEVTNNLRNLVWKEYLDKKGTSE